MKLNKRSLLLVLLGTVALVGCQQQRHHSGHHSSHLNVDNNVSGGSMCVASQYQNYVGKPLTSVNKNNFSMPVRVLPYNGAATMDLNMNRLNFVGDKEGMISRVYCG